MIIKNAEVLNSKRIKQILQLLKLQWNYSETFEYGFLQKENDLFLITRDLDKIDVQEVNVNSLGMYFGELRHDTLRLSIEGSQIVGKNATKNVMELNNEQLQHWLRGDDMDVANIKGNYGDNNFVLIKHEKNFYGCGRVKDGTLLNFVPKSRRFLV